MPASQNLVDTSSLKTRYRYFFAQSLKLEYPEQSEPLEAIRPVLAEIGIPTGIVLGEALGDTLEATLKKKPWLEEKFGLTRERIALIRPVLLNWYAAMKLPDDPTWAEFVLGLRPIPPSLSTGGQHIETPSLSSFLTQRWLPGWQTRTEYLKEAMDQLQSYCDAVEAAVGESGRFTSIPNLDLDLLERDVTWMAWSQVEGLSQVEIAGRWGSRGEEFFSHTTVGNVLNKTRKILGL